MIELLSALSAAGFECLVVDDGSGTDYAGIFDRARQYAEVITHGENRGKGAAIKTGLRHIADVHSDSRIIVTVDADGQHRPEDVLRVCEDAEAHMGALCLGSRAFTGRVTSLIYASAPSWSRQNSAVWFASPRTSASRAQAKECCPTE